MDFEVSVDIDAEREAVWAVLIDVEHWPRWTSSMQSVLRVGHDPLAVGSEVRVKQPKLAASRWRITELDPPRSFSWVSHSAGVTTVADHELADHGGATRATLRLRQSGRLAPVIALLAGSLIRRYVRLEADGLKRECETASR